MKTLTTLVLGAALFPLLASAADSPAPRAAKAAPVADDGQDFVFLGESRPVLIRLHMRADGKPLQAAWDECIDYLFRYLDVNGDGVLTKDEVERVPTVDQLTGGVLTRGFGGGGRRGGAPAPSGPTMADLDTDGDGKVTRTELASYYRKKGFVPFQFKFASNQPNPFGAAAAFLGGPRSEPTVDAVSKAIFNLLDTNHDGKLTKEKLEAAPALLLKLDDDEDEIVTMQELVPDNGPNLGLLAGFAGMGGPRAPTVTTSSPTLVPVLKRGEVPADLVKRMTERYGKGGKSDEKKLSRKDIGLDEKSFADLDKNGDGVLNAEELAGFVKRDPDLEFELRLGTRAKDQVPVESMLCEHCSPLVKQLSVDGNVAFVDLGLTRVDLRTNEQERPDPISGFARQQFLSQFSQADKDGNGVLDEKEIAASRTFRSLAKVIDRDGDGKITQQKLTAYLDHLEQLTKRATAGTVTLEITDQSRGLFDLLDTNRDGRLSVREMRSAPKLLAKFDRGNKGFLTKEDLPRSYRLEVRRGPANQGNLGGFNFFDLYGGSYAKAEVETNQRGPLWFRKMDRNRDGDVSRKEWLFSEELFRLIDTDGDGLISVEEAEKAADLLERMGRKDR